MFVFPPCVLFVSCLSALGTMYCRSLPPFASPWWLDATLCTEACTLFQGWSGARSAPLAASAQTTWSANVPQEPGTCAPVLRGSCRRT